MTRPKPSTMMFTATFAASLLVTFTNFATSFAARPEKVGAASVGIKRLDSDGDGRLSREEHAAGARKMFEGMDADKDGKVTAAEMDTAHAHTTGRRPARSQKESGLRAADKIKVLDADKDGALTAAEHAAGTKAMFDKMDTDKDQFLSSTELAAGHAKLLRKKGR